MYWLWWRLYSIGRSIFDRENDGEDMPAIEEVAGGGITRGGAGGASKVARAPNRLGLGKTMEGFVGFTTGLTSSSSRNTYFRCCPSRSASCIIASTLK